MNTAAVPQLRLFGSEQSGAVISADERYRYLLWRVWDAKLPMLGGLMCNPSNADSERNDPTILRWFHRTRLEGYGGFMICNAYGFRSPDPDALWLAETIGIDIVGPENDSYIQYVVEQAPTILLGYGNNPRADRVTDVLKLLDGADLRHLGLTNSGRPKHLLSRGKGWIPDSQAMKAFK